MKNITTQISPRQNQFSEFFHRIVHSDVHTKKNHEFYVISFFKIDHYYNKFKQNALLSYPWPTAYNTSVSFLEIFCSFCLPETAEANPWKFCWSSWCKVEEVIRNFLCRRAIRKGLWSLIGPPFVAETEKDHWILI